VEQKRPGDPKSFAHLLERERPQGEGF